MAEKQARSLTRLQSLRVRRMKGISGQTEGLTPEQVELLSKWKSELKAEGTALQKRRDLRQRSESLKGANEKSRR